LRWHSAGPPQWRAIARQAALLTAHAMCSADAGSRSSRHRRRRFPQALGESPPPRAAAAAGPPPGRAPRAAQQPRKGQCEQELHLTRIKDSKHRHSAKNAT